jgi:cell division septum initiation protein DivIVA
MTDSTFRFSALDARRYDFGTAWRGYDKTRVEQFREQAAAEIERLTRANQELDEKARGFLEQLRAFRERDRAMNEALIAAHKLREDSQAQAEREAEVIRGEARLEAERVIRAARADAERQVEQLRGEVRRIEEEIASLDRVHRTYIAQLRLQAERQLAELEASEATTLPPIPQRGRLAAGTDETNGPTAETTE